MPSPASSFAILLAGPLQPTPRLRAQLQGRRVIAADGGIRHAALLGVEPEVWVGDSDSSDPADRRAHPAMRVETFPPAKAATDGALALAEARRLGAGDVLLVGAFGGQTDHAFGLMAQACRLGGEGLAVTLTSGMEEAVPLGPHPRSFDLPPGTRFSVLGFSDLEGLTLQGARWPLDDACVAFGDTLVLSNAVEGTLTARLRAGRALLVATLAADA